MDTNQQGTSPASSSSGQDPRYPHTHNPNTERINPTNQPGPGQHQGKHHHHGHRDQHQQYQQHNHTADQQRGNQPQQQHTQPFNPYHPPYQQIYNRPAHTIGEGQQSQQTNTGQQTQQYYPPTQPNQPPQTHNQPTQPGYPQPYYPQTQYQPNQAGQVSNQQTQQQTQPYSQPQMQAITAETSPEAQLNPQLLYTWKAPLRPYKKRGKKVLRFFVAVAVLLSLIIFFLGDTILIVPIWTLIFLFYVLTITPPPTVENKITPFGIDTAGVTIRWEVLSHFYFTKRFEYNILTLVTHGPYFLQSYLVVPNDEIKAILIAFLSHHIVYQAEPRRNITDKMVDWMSHLIPEDDEEESKTDTANSKPQKPEKSDENTEEKTMIETAHKERPSLFNIIVKMMQKTKKEDNKDPKNTVVSNQDNKETSNERTPGEQTNQQSPQI